MTSASSAHPPEMLLSTGNGPSLRGVVGLRTSDDRADQPSKFAGKAKLSEPRQSGVFSNSCSETHPIEGTGVSVTSLAVRMVPSWVAISVSAPQAKHLIVPS